MPIAIHYRFRQNFTVPARKAYDWCLDFQSGAGDHALMGESGVDRKVSRVSDRTIILTDTFEIGDNRMEKQKLVQIYPEMLFWTSTHLTGPARHSQFLYQITADSEDASHLDFTGLFLDYAHEKMTEVDARTLSDKLCKEDAGAWRLLAEAVEKDLGAGAK